MLASVLKCQFFTIFLFALFFIFLNTMITFETGEYNRKLSSVKRKQIERHLLLLQLVRYNDDNVTCSKMKKNTMYYFPMLTTNLTVDRTRRGSCRALKTLSSSYQMPFTIGHLLSITRGGYYLWMFHRFVFVAFIPSLPFKLGLDFIV